LPTHSASPTLSHSQAPRIGLLGGSFDPIHVAHIALANYAVQALSLQYLELIPAANPWQRAPLAATAAQRLAMLELALQGHPQLRINPIEIERSGPTYTLDTLRALPTGPHYFWVLGSDQLQNFCTWHGWQEILGFVTLAVAQRPHTSLSLPPKLKDYLQQKQLPLQRLDFTPVDISATEIRQRIKAHQSTAGLLDPKVQQYIKRHQLYLK